ncbi:hypothetical protein KAH37_08830 [bacterium]|nr:hypothetical protein [bacterium]
MKNRVLLVIGLLLMTFAVNGASGWKTVEEIVINGTKVNKETLVFGDVMKMINKTDKGGNETIIDLSADQITLINHFDKSYQVLKLSKYIEFAEGMLKEMTAQGRINPDKIPPKITYKKGAIESVTLGKSTHYSVAVDGKPYMEVWVAPELKDSSLIGFRDKFAKMLPSDLTKYRSIDAKIRDHLSAEGLIIKQIKTPFNKKLPKSEQTMLSMEKIEMPPKLIVIPDDYVSKTSK